MLNEPRSPSPPAGPTRHADAARRAAAPAPARTRPATSTTAFAIDGLINLYEATSTRAGWRRPRRCATPKCATSAIRRAGGFFFTADDAERVLVRAKDADDNAIPSGNSVMLLNLQRLGASSVLHRDGQARGRAADDRAKAGASPSTRRRRTAAGGVDFHHDRAKEIVLILPELARLPSTSSVPARWGNACAFNKVVVGAIGRGARRRRSRACRSWPIARARDGPSGRRTCARTSPASAHDRARGVETPACPVEIPAPGERGAPRSAREVHPMRRTPAHQSLTAAVEVLGVALAALRVAAHACW
ncbi:MAG: hypothetical protein U1A27_06135 [Phycisphaerae bacterium]